MHGTHFLGGHSCGLELLRLLTFLMGLKVYKRTSGNAEVQQKIIKSLIDKNYHPNLDAANQDLLKNHLIEVLKI